MAGGPSLADPCEGQMGRGWLMGLLLGWAKSLYFFFLKRHIFHFPNNFIDLDILSMLAIVPY